MFAIGTNITFGCCLMLDTFFILAVKKKKSPIIANDNHAKDGTSSRHSACECVDVAPELS